MASEQPTSDYILPRHASEADRLDLQHRLLCRTFGGLYRAPIEPAKIHRVLDVGCGTGIWTVDFARRHPDVEVHGFDLHESPAWASAPPNCKLRVANLEEAATWSGLENRFDFIYGRMIVVSVKDWPLLFRRCFDMLALGGWLEIQDLQFPIRCTDADVAKDSRFVQWSHLMIEGMHSFHLSPLVMDTFPAMLGEIGFEQVDIEHFRMFTGPWSNVEEERELGRMGLTNLSLGVRGFSSTLFTKGLGWTGEQHEEIVQEVLHELREGKFRTYMPMKVCFARKPE